VYTEVTCSKKLKVKCWLRSCSKDVLHEDRVHGAPEEADLSNFLHPVLYYYSTPPNPGMHLCVLEYNLEYLSALNFGIRYQMEDCLSPKAW